MSNLEFLVEFSEKKSLTFLNLSCNVERGGCFNHSALTAAAKTPPIEFLNQQAPPIRSLAFSPADGRPYPVSGSKVSTAINVITTF